MSPQPFTPVAVIGMSCRLPGGINSPEQLWDALLDGRDLVTEIPSDRWDVDEYYDPEPNVPNRTVSRWGAFLDDIAGFDAEFFGISPREATAIDPQQRILLETSWEAVESAGLSPATLAGSLTSVHIGMSHDDYVFVASDADALGDPYAFTGNAPSMASGRIAYALGLQGPALTVDSACSSSLSAVHLACRGLQAGDSDLALAGGAMIMLEPQKFVSASAQGMLSPTGRCHSFDVDADGFVRSEGSVMVVLKRLADAERDGDRVLAVIRGTASNQDGSTENIATPSADAQERAYRAALANADVEPSTVGMVEAHGTGTPVGDPLEYDSLSRVYGIDRPTALVSTKTNFGHAESAAGALGLIKAVMAVRHGLIPKILHHTRLPDELAKVKTQLFIPTEHAQWPHNAEVRRAAVSSYGMSGTNVHAIIEQAPSLSEPSDVTEGSNTEPQLFALSSTSPEQLAQTATNLQAWLDRNPETDLSDLAYTLGRRRGHRTVRAATIAANRDELAAGLSEIAVGDAAHQETVGHDNLGPVWVFSGQGSQWAEMGARLLETEPEFAAKIAEIEPLIAAESGFSVTEALLAPEVVTGIDRVQPTLFAMQVAFAAAMDAHGVRPGAVIGHSLGEVGASVVAGSLSLADGVRVICRRSELCARLAGGGLMASIEQPAQQVRDDLAAVGVTNVVVAVIASPQSTVIGGDPQAVRDMVADYDKRGVLAREVAVDVASHSPHVDSILDELAEVLADVEPLTPTVPYYSATLFDPRGELHCDAEYWVDNLRHAVRFSAAVQAALEDGFRVFGELSPHPLLTRDIDQTAEGVKVPVAAIPAMRRGSDLPSGLLTFLGDLFVAGAAIDFSVSFPSGKLLDAPLPAWTHRPLLLQRNSGDRHGTGAHSVAAHPLLGAHVELLEEPARDAWQGEVGIAAVPWLDDHQVHNVAALPGAAYCEMALSAARATLGESSEVRDIVFEQMLLLDAETTIAATAVHDAPGRRRFTIETGSTDNVSRRATATLAVRTEDDVPSYNIPDLLATHPVRVDGGQLREWFDVRGVQFGPAFTGLTAAHVGEVEVTTILAEVALPSSIRSQQAGYSIHPALLDSCFQSVAAHPAVQAAGNGGLLLPLGVDRLRAHGSTKAARYCLTRITSADGAGATADLDIVNEAGQVLFQVQGLRMGSTADEASERDRVFSERLLAIEWQSAELPEAAEQPGKWLVIGSDNDLYAHALCDALKFGGAEVASLPWPLDGDEPELSRRLVEQLTTGEFSGVVQINGEADVVDPVDGFKLVQRLIHIARTIPELEIETPP